MPDDLKTQNNKKYYKHNRRKYDIISKYFLDGESILGQI